MAYYVVDENNNRVEALDKEGVFALLNQAINDGTLSEIMKDSAFVSKLKCCVGGDTFKMAFITQQKYNELEANNELLPNAIYYIVDDTSADDINEAVETINSVLTEQGIKIENILNGALKAHTAQNAEKTDFTNGEYYEVEKTHHSCTEVNYKAFGLDKPCLFYVDDVDGTRHSLGVVIPPKEPTSEGEYTYSHSSIININVESVGGNMQDVYLLITRNNDSADDPYYFDLCLKGKTENIPRDEIHPFVIGWKPIR